MSRRGLTDAEFRAWLAAPLPVADLLRIELDEARYLAAVEAAEAEEAAEARVRASVAARAGRPSYAELCDLRGERARAAAATFVAADVAVAFEGLGAASRAVTRRRRDEARRAPATAGGRG